MNKTGSRIFYTLLIVLAITATVFFASVLVSDVLELREYAATPTEQPAVKASTVEMPVLVPITVVVTRVVTQTTEPVMSTATPSAPEYTVVDCGVRPRNGTLIRLAATTSRACSDSRCKNQGKVIAGSVRPLEAWDYDETSGAQWLRFTYLPLEDKPYNLLEWEKKDGEWQWVLVHQWVSGQEGEEFWCVVAQ